MWQIRKERNERTRSTAKKSKEYHVRQGEWKLARASQGVSKAFRAMTGMGYSRESTSAGGGASKVMKTKLKI